MTLPLLVPGGVEVAIILFVSLLLFSPVVALAYLVLFRPDREDDATADRVDELEAEVAELRERLESETGDGDENGPPSGRDGG